ncbi:MAG: hypothetical protein K2M17_02325 [Bacilli bacterium]|nr:hypothetical protein [Bacilli bacterium]
MSTKPALSQNCNTQACTVPCSSNGTEVSCPSTQCVCDATSFDFINGVHTSCVLKDSNSSIGDNFCENIDEYETSNNTYKYLSVYAKYEFPSDFDYSYFNVPDINGGSYAKINNWSDNPKGYESHYGNPTADGFDGSALRGKTSYWGNLPCLCYPHSGCYSNISQAVATVRAHFKSRYSNRNKYQFWVTYYVFAWREFHKSKFKRIAPYCVNSLAMPVEIDGKLITEGKCFSAEYENSSTGFLVTDNSALAKKAVAESFVNSFYNCYVLGVDSFIGSYNTVPFNTKYHCEGERPFQVPYYLFQKSPDGTILRTKLSTKDKGLYDQVIISGTGTSMDGTYNNLRASNYARERKWNKNREIWYYPPNSDGSGLPSNRDEPLIVIGHGTWDDDDGYYYLGIDSMTDKEREMIIPTMNGWDLIDGS